MTKIHIKCIQSQVPHGLNRTCYLPDESSSWSMDQMPPVGSKILPSNILRVVPESTDLRHQEKYILLIPSSHPDEYQGKQIPHLSRSVSCVPESIPEVLSWAGGRVDHFDG